MVLKGKVEDVALLAFRKAQYEALRTERLGLIHVSDLIKPCLRYSYYHKEYPPMLDTKALKSMFYGQAVHKVTNMSTDPKMNEFLMMYNFIGEVNVEPWTTENWDNEGGKKWFDVIVGTIDDILMVDGEIVICDKKTTGNLSWAKKGNMGQSYRDQLNAYKYLYYMATGNEVKKGCIIYIENSVDPENYQDVVPVAAQLESIPVIESWLIPKAKAFRDYLMKNELPPLTRCYLCDGMCPYIEKCGLNEK